MTGPEAYRQAVDAFERAKRLARTRDPQAAMQTALGNGYAQLAIAAALAPETQDWREALASPAREK
ncbi:hypothetical protein BJF83_22420 [Nocardiopsis sp. CNR-923]|uniref:hypothetical protein n=1 Tax=Nocardiopsis sp. CNR-923 TaxID=1904965 RepID=UPI000968B8B0|nr:hypothetical protein [Nocardiopsis sp. CNR-923]OLT25839.1 hypothetical protein BJF83_22420 [Nocardiopsis sp. CNR-923]